MLRHAPPVMFHHGSLTRVLNRTRVRIGVRNKIGTKVRLRVKTFHKSNSSPDYSSDSKHNSSSTQDSSQRSMVEHDRRSMAQHDQRSIQYIEANNLYGYALRQTLPYKKFSFTDISLDEVLNTSDESNYVYWIVCDKLNRQM